MRFTSFRNSLIVLTDPDCTDCGGGGLGRALAVVVGRVVVNFFWVGRTIFVYTYILMT